MLQETIAKYPRHKAIISNKTIHYQELGEQVNRVAHALMSLNVVKGNKIGLFLSNCPEFIYAYFGALSIGAVIVPINTFLQTPEIEYIVRDCQLDVFIVHTRDLPIVSGFSPKLIKRLIVIGSEKERQFICWQEIIRREPATRAHRKIEPDDMAAILYTSGTTGHPKGVVLSHQNLLANVRSCCRVIKVTGKDRILCVLPLFHAFTSAVCMLIPFYKGGAMILLSKIERKSIRKALLWKRPTILVGIPQLYHLLAQYPYFRPLKWLNPIKFCISGAAPLSMETLVEFEGKCGIPLLEGYGLSEASPVVAINPLEGERKRTSVGLPLPDVMVKVLDEEENELPPKSVGEVVVKGENVMQGYYNRPEETKRTIRGGWLFTGDMGRLDEEGYLYLVDRKKDMLLVNGLNVYPREIEEVLNNHPKIQESAVIGRSSGLKGEVPKAFIVLKENETMTPQEVRSYSKRFLASYKIPKFLEFRVSLPKTPTGKILKKILRKEEEQKIHDQGD